MSRLGGAQLTATGEQALRIYRAIERECQRAVDKQLKASSLSWPHSPQRSLRNP